MRNIRTFLPNPFLSTRLFGVLLILFILLSVTVTAFMQDQKKPVLVETPTVMPVDRAGLADSKARPSGGAKEASASVGAEQASASVGVDTNQAPINPIKSPDGPTVAGTCDTAGPIEVESSGGTAAGVPTPYATLALAFTAINGGTIHTGTITIDVCGNTTETGTGASLNQVAGVTSVTMSPAGGAARTISGAITAGSPLINLNGADNVTINGLNTGGNSLTISNTTASATTGTSTIRFIADATNNTVTNTTISGSSTSTSTSGTATGTVLFSTGTTTGNDNNTVSNCNIGPAGANLPSKAITAVGSSSSIENDNVQITGNNIFDFFLATGSTTGIYITTGNEGWTISNNKFYQTATRTFTTSALRYAAITLSNSTGAFTISGNTIGFGAANGTGTTTISGSSNEFRGIDAPSVNTATATSIQGNTISGINQTSSRASTSLGGSAFIAITIGETGGLFNVGNTTGNTVGSLDASSSIVIAESSTTTSTAPVIGIYDFSFSNDNLSNNKFGTITINSGGSGTTVGFRGILINGTSGQSVTVNNNVIGGTAAGSITDNIVGSYGMYAIQNTASTTSANLSATGNVIRNMSGNSNGAGLIISSGILFSPASAGANTISQNTIHSLSNASGAAANSIYGMSLTLPSAANVIERNLIHSFSLTSTVTGTQIWGISTGSTGTATYKNNMIRLGLDAAGNSVTLPSSVIGIRDITGATNQFYYNSVYIGGTGVLATPAASNSYCFYSDVVTVTRAYQDNIFWNARSNAASGGVAHIAIRVGGTAANPAGLTSNYNDLYFSGTDGVTGVFNGAIVSTLAAWRTATGQDANSIAADPLFTAPTGTAATVDLHINPATAASSPVNNAGTPIAGVTNDFDNDTRSATTPDIGADEFSVNFSSSGSGNLAAGTYDSITINSPDVVTLTGNISVATAIIVKNGATLNCGTFIVSGTATFLLEAGGTLGVGDPGGVTTSGATGNIRVTGARTYTTGANYVYNGTAAQVTGNALSNAPNNLTINNTAGVTSSVTGLTVSGTLRVQAGTFTSASTYNIVQIDNGATLAASSGETINVSGNWTNDGAFTANGSTVRFNGGSPQTLGGSQVTTFSGLTINGAGVTMANNATVNGTLTLTSGLITTGANTLTLGGSATASGASSSSYVNGNLKKIYSAPGSFTFDVGDAGYSPVTINATAGSGDVTAKAVHSFQPRMGNTAKALQRYWTLTDNGITNADLTFKYLDGDVPGTANESNFIIFKIDGNTVATPGGSVDTATNTATINGVTSFSDWTLGEPNAPTLVKLRGFNATRDHEDVMIRWQSGYEVDNLGYNLYREQNGQRSRVTRSMIAGSALLAGERTVLTAGQPHTWFDRLPAGTGRVSYWLEDVDVNGKRTIHGPITPVTGKVDRHQSAQAQTVLLDQLSAATASGQQAWPTAWSKQQARLNKIGFGGGTVPDRQHDVAGLPGVKIMVRQEGWVRVSQPELVAAGLDPTVAAPYLQLYAEGREVPIIVSASVSAKQFTASDWIEFYGQGLDTPTANTQTYYLVAGTSEGKRIARNPAQGTGQSGAQSFSNIVESKERSVYFSGLDNGDAENFFGQIITPTAVSSALVVQHLDATVSSAQLRVTLQGVTAGSHQVNVQVNGADVGTISFADREHPAKTFNISPTMLHEGDNNVQMVAANGETDVSLVDTLQLTYAHTYTADNNRLQFSIRGGATVNIGGFNGPNIRIVDITDPYAIQELVPGITSSNGSYTASVQVAAVKSQTVKTLMAFVDNEVDHPALLTKNEPSSLSSNTNGADFLIITQRAFRDHVEPLAQLRRSQGLQVSVVDVEDVYDEFSYGAHSPQALRDFINRAAQNWQHAPHYILLVGDATYDPRNYLAQGDNDLMPTKMVYAGTMETASDDWLADFNNDGVPDLAVGRLPVRTSQEAATIISKITGYSPSSAGQGALLIADRNDDQDNFEGASQNVQSLLPADTQVQVINRGNQDTATVHSQIVNGINQGPLVVNYYGHGSVGLWTGSGLLSTSDAAALTNGTRLPLFTIMTCLNGFFQDVNGESMSEALLKAPQGGAVAVWASSGLTEMNRQSEMDQQLYGTIFGAQSVPLGDAVRAAKAATQDRNVRRTWVFFGDPTMRLR